MSLVQAAIYYAFLYCVSGLSYQARNRGVQPHVRYEAVSSSWETVYGHTNDLDDQTKNVLKERVCKKNTNYFFKNSMSVAEFNQKLFCSPLNTSKFGMRVRALWGLDLTKDEVANIWEGEADFMEPASDLHQSFITSPKADFLRGGNFRQFWSQPVLDNFYRDVHNLAEVPNVWDVKNADGFHPVWNDPSNGGARLHVLCCAVHVIVL